MNDVTVPVASEPGPNDDRGNDHRPREMHHGQTYHEVSG